MDFYVVHCILNVDTCFRTKTTMWWHLTMMNQPAVHLTVMNTLILLVCKFFISLSKDIK